MISLAAGLDRSRFSPKLIVLNAEGPLSQRLPDDVPVSGLGRVRLRSALPALRREIFRLRPAIVFSTLGYLNQGILALRPLLPGGIRIVVREANLPTRTDLGRVGRLLGLGYRHLYPRADVIVCPARRVAETLAEKYAIPVRKLEVIYNPVDEVALRAAAARPRRRDGPGLRLVAAGRLTVQKGFDRLIEMLPEFPDDCHVTIFGDGPLREELAADAERRGLGHRIVFGGYSESPWEFYAGADAFLLPSRWEGLPNAALEALACGTPVIATPEAGGIGEIAELASPGAVTLAATGEPFARAVTCLSPQEIEAPRPSLLPRAFRPETVVGQYEALFEALAR